MTGRDTPSVDSADRLDHQRRDSVAFDLVLTAEQLDTLADLVAARLAERQPQAPSKWMDTAAAAE